MVEVSWTSPLSRTGCRFRSAIPYFNLKLSRSDKFSVLLGGLLVLVVLSIFFGTIQSALFNAFGRPALSLLAVPVLLFTSRWLIPQVRSIFQGTYDNTQPISSTEARMMDIYKDPMLVREPREGNAPTPPDDLDTFTTNEATNLQINRCDANLLEATWQHCQIRALKLITLKRLHEWYMLEFSGNVRKDWNLILPLLVYPAVYGSIHFMGLDATFRSETVKFLWKASSIIVCTGIPASVPVMYLIIWLVKKYRSVPSPPRTWHWLAMFPRLRTCLHYIWCWSLMALYFIFAFTQLGLALIYLAARFFLLVESFIALTHQPGAVYEVRPWAAYWPHIS